MLVVLSLVVVAALVARAVAKPATPVDAASGQTRDVT